MSTAHIEQRYAQRLEPNRPNVLGDLDGGVIATTPHGVLLWIGHEGPANDSVATLTTLGFSPAFAQLLTHVQEAAEGFCYVLLDPDGIPIDELPTFQWRVHSTPTLVRLVSIVINHRAPRRPSWAWSSHDVPFLSA